MAKFLTVMVPEPGHIIPALELARALKELGHTTCFATFDHFHDNIRDAGFDCAYTRVSRPLRSTCANLLYSPLSAIDTRDASQKSDDQDEFQYFVLDVLDAVRKVKPDIVLIDRVFVQIGRLFDTLNIRYLIVGSNYGDSLESLESYNLKRNAELLLCPRALALAEDLRDSNRYYFETSITRDRSVPYFPWQTIDLARPLVYCSFGTQIDTYPAAPAVLRDILHHLTCACSYQVVVVVGATFLREFGDLALPGVILTHCAPQLDLIERATMLISHGGLGTIKEALHFAVPMFLIPFAYDQFANANRVVAAGCGYQLSSLSWSDDKFKAQYTVFEQNLPRLRENLFKLRAHSLAADGKRSLWKLSELVSCVLRSPA
jgi:UDP:flavonoid glycosyltransferase YjiC (YdhE family)